MQEDLGSRDRSFLEIVAQIRRVLLEVAHLDPERYCAIPMQGSGTFSVEAVLSSVVPRNGRVLVLVNGAYGRRMANICQRLSLPHHVLECSERSPHDPAMVEATLDAAPDTSHVAVVHCETSTGLLNPVRDIGAVVARAGRSYLVDAMSSFGGMDLRPERWNVDYLVSSANKCLEGVPGFAFVLARKAALRESEGHARSLSLDLLEQWKGLERNGQFRFTPPTHCLLAFRQALVELEQEGGVKARAARYRANHVLLLRGMRQLGFRRYLPPENQSHVITSFLYPAHPRWSFQRFYDELNSRGMVIYPGKVSDADCFRIGTIGRMDQQDVRALLRAVGETMTAMGMDSPAQGRQHSWAGEGNTGGPGPA